MSKSEKCRNNNSYKPLTSRRTDGGKTARRCAVTDLLAVDV